MKMIFPKEILSTKVISVAGDGTNAGTGANAKGIDLYGNDNVPWRSYIKNCS